MTLTLRIVTEINFWEGRLRNLQYIYEQLRDERVWKMAVILERTDSAYFPCFKNIFRNIVAGQHQASTVSVRVCVLELCVS